MRKIRIAQKWARKSIVLLVIIILIHPPVSAQQKLPIIKATSKTVDIRYGDELRKASWFLDPLAKPDVLAIRQNPEEVKKVTFCTDIDSITFEAKAGQTYNFIVLLNNTEPCYTQIAVVSTQGILINSGYYIPILFGILLLIIIGYQNRKKMQLKPLLYLGLITPVLYWLFALIGGFIHGNYHHVTMTVSELGAIGTQSELFMASAELVLALLIVITAIGFYQASKETGITTFPVITILSLPITMVWAALFPLGHDWHGALGPVALLLWVGTLMGFILWREKKQLRLISLLSLTSFIIMSLLFLRFIPALQHNFPGLIQKFFYLGWSVWSISLSFCFLELIQIKKQTLLNFSPEELKKKHLANASCA